jgi:hypothetical protein
MSGWREISADEAPSWLSGERERNLLAPMPGWLREGVELVLSEMQLPSPVHLRVVFEPDGAYGVGMLYIWEQDVMGGSGYMVARTRYAPR